MQRHTCDPNHPDAELWDSLHRLSEVVAKQHEMLEAGGLMDTARAMAHATQSMAEKAKMAVAAVASKADAKAHGEVATDGWLHNTTDYSDDKHTTLIQDAKLDGKTSLAEAQTAQRAASVALAAAMKAMEQAHKAADTEDKARPKTATLSPADVAALNTRAETIKNLETAVDDANTRMEAAKTLVGERLAALKSAPKFKIEPKK